MTSSPITVLLVCHDGELFGSQHSLLLLIKHLDPSRIKVVVSIARPGPLEEALKGMSHVTVTHHKRLYWAKHDPRNLLQRMGDVFSLLVSAPSRVSTLAQVVKRHQVDVIHANSVVSLEAGLAAWLTRKPLVWHIRELFAQPNPKLYMTLGRRFSRWLIARLASRVVCISQAVKAQFGRAVDNTRYPVIYNATENMEPVTVRADDGVFRVGFIGRLTEGKRFQDVVEALTLMGDTPTHLTVAGKFVDKAFEAKITQQIARHQLSEHITFLGYQRNLRPLYESLDVLVVPSLNEPFGRVVIEAMAHGVSVIGANSGGIAEIIEDGHTGLLVPPCEPQALAKALQQLATSPQTRLKLRENACAAVAKRFTIEAQVAAIQSLYDSLTAR